MRIILAIIATLAFISAALTAISYSNTPSEARLLAFISGSVSFVVFVFAGAASAALDHLGRLRREAEKQTTLLETIVRLDTAGDASPKSSVRYGGTD